MEAIGNILFIIFTMSILIPGMFVWFYMMFEVLDDILFKREK